MEPTIFRNFEAFWAEWYEATQAMIPRTADILEATVVQNWQAARLAEHYQVSEERIRQLCVKAQKQLRHATEQNPDGELAHTAKATSHWAERAGLYDAFQFRRVASSTKTRLADQLIRLGVLDPTQIDSLTAACAVTNIPKGQRTSLAGMALDLRKIITHHPAGIAPQQVRQELHDWHGKLEKWTQLEIGTFATSWLNLAPSNEDGKFRPERNQTKPSYDDQTLAKHYLAQALIDANKCMNFRTIVADANQIARENGLDSNYQERTSHTIIMKDDIFKWVGNSTYGLADWEVGHTDPSKKKGRRLQVSDEIIHLLEKAGKSLPIETVSAHINQRFTIGDTTIRAGINNCPTLLIHNGMVHLMREQEAKRAKTAQREVKTMQTGNRAYSSIERKRRKRQHRRANKGLPKLARRTRAKNIMNAMRLRGAIK